MYCVKCGVKLRDGSESCPLCGTKVYNPDNNPTKNDSYSDILPKVSKGSRRPEAIAMTVICALAAAIILLICSEVYGALSWGGYVTLGIALFYIVVVMPMWFNHPSALVFIPVSFAALLGYLLYICLKTGGNWFLSFAFPVGGIFCLILTLAVMFGKIFPNGKMFATGGFFILLGGHCMLIEMFEHITFGTPMFIWSFYPLAVFLACGIFLILVGIIRPLREFMNKNFFV